MRGGSGRIAPAARSVSPTSIQPHAGGPCCVAARPSLLTWVLIVGAFYVLPIGHESGLRAFVRLGADIALIGAVFAWQIRRISVAELPELRAVEALGIVIAVFLVLFSAIYLAMSHEAARTFTQPLDHTRALYFTITIFSTVGFGDITPRTDTARLCRLGADAARPRHHRCSRAAHLQRCPLQDRPDRPSGYVDRGQRRLSPAGSPVGPSTVAASL